ncbi:MAG TPA: replication-relaxation family protein, partial [Vicinamibacterales bacterium]|nr:replication-relaxation family protein [Vicinamibacterales bacterium]
MTGRLTWRDAEAAAERLTPGDRRTLQLLARLPLIWEYAIEQLCGLQGDTSVYRGLIRLRALGLIAEVRPALHAGRNAGLHYLTDLGIATVAVDRQVDPAYLAWHARLRGLDLRRRLLRLLHLLALYQMLAALADVRAGRIDLLAWEQPWRRSFRLPMRKAPVTVNLPAYAVLSWDDDAAEYLLLPDLATFPLRAHGQTFRWLATLRRRVGSTFPTLVVATTDDRQMAWVRLLDEAARSRGCAPLGARIVTWQSLRDDMYALGDAATATRPSTTVGVVRPSLRPLDPRRSGRPIPRLVGAVCRPDASTSEDLGCLALQVSPMERVLLDVVGRHPFLTAESLATILGWQVRRVRARRARLIGLGLVRLLGAGERRESLPGDLPELTQTGLAFVAAQQGLSLPRAVRFNGLAGGGPEHPTGMRRLLLRDLEHTLGTDAVFVGLYRQFEATAEKKGGDALLEWRNAAACGRRRVRPDGYGMIRRNGELYGFFLEYDRGTMSVRDYDAKWAGYHDYRDSRAFERDYDGFPTILVVTTNKTAEERIARSARAAAVGRWAPLPILLTCEWRISIDHANHDGLFGPIWRDPHDGVASRRR